jgi:hypothetical protein
MVGFLRCSRGDAVSGGLLDTSKNGHDTIYFHADCMLRSWYLICNLVAKAHHICSLA